MTVLLGLVQHVGHGGEVGVEAAGGHVGADGVGVVVRDLRALVFVRVHRVHPGGAQLVHEPPHVPALLVGGDEQRYVAHTLRVVYHRDGLLHGDEVVQRVYEPAHRVLLQRGLGRLACDGDGRDAGQRLGTDYHELAYLLRERHALEYDLRAAGSGFRRRFRCRLRRGGGGRRALRGRNAAGAKAERENQYECNCRFFHILLTLSSISGIIQVHGISFPMTL